MGLDMYLSAKNYLSLFDEKQKNIAKEISLLLGLNNAKKEAKNPFDFEVKAVELSIGYWRKANAIHDWFVKNIQYGEDDCQEHWVDYDQLLKLKYLCETVLENKSLAENLLPSRSGFFFGSTEYDEWYFESLEQTVEIIQKVEDNKKSLANFDFYYRSSW